MNDHQPPQEKKPLSLKSKISPERVSALHDLLMPLKKQLEDKEKQERTNKPYFKKQKGVGQTKEPPSDAPTDSKHIRNENIQQTLDWLYRTFPLCFDRENPKPLKRRIEKDIYPHLPEDQSISRLTLRRTIAFYTRWSKYRKALTVATHRFDLQGNPAEEIQGAHKERAMEQLKEQTERRKTLNPHHKVRKPRKVLVTHTKRRFPVKKETPNT